MKAWGDWFASLGEQLVDGGNPFGAGRAVTADGVTDLSNDAAPITATPSSMPRISTRPRSCSPVVP